MKKLLNRILKKEDPQEKEVILIIRIADAIRLNEVDTIEELDMTAGFLMGEAYSDMKHGDITAEGYKALENNLVVIHKSRRQTLENM